MLKVGILLLMAMAFLATGKVSSVDMRQLQHEVQRANDTLYVVNFWATWCKPCVNEMPYFQEASKKFATQKVKVVFVSLNSAKEITQVEKFATDKQVKEKIVLLNAGNPNNWIDTIDNTWSGAIPATVMYRKGQKIFFREGEFTQRELDSIIHIKNQ